MAVPKFFEFLPAVLHLLRDGREKPLSLIRKEAIEHMKVSPADCEELLPSGRQRTVDNRINWAAVYLKKAGLISTVRRGVYAITQEGLRAYSETNNQITLKYLERYSSFCEFHGGTDKSESEKEEEQPLLDTPQDIIEKAHRQIKDALSEELLSAIMERSPRFFENLVVELLLKMGYGGAFDSAGLVVGKSGDEGIDGIIREDKLGFSSIYIQAKRWEPSSTVGRPEVQKFVGALAGQGATKGLFITTAQFSKEAIGYVEKQLAAKVVLVDGHQLTHLMMEYGIGVSVQSTYMIKKLDSDYFEDESI